MQNNYLNEMTPELNYEFEHLQHGIVDFGNDIGLDYLKFVSYLAAKGLLERNIFVLSNDKNKIEHFIQEYEHTLFNSNGSNYETRDYLDDFYSRLIEPMSTDDIKNLVIDAIHKFENDSNRFYMLSDNAINDIIYRLLKFENGDSFYDCGSGFGLVLIDEYLKAKEEGIDISLNGIELSPSQAELSEVLILLLRERLFSNNIYCGDVFDYSIAEIFNKGYVFPPYGANYSCPVMSELNGFSFRSNRLSQWAYVDRLLSHINFKDGGRAIALLFAGSFIEARKNEYLQYLLSTGLIEGIIKLPPLLKSTSLSPILVVFSKDNDAVKVVDASSDDFVITSKKYNLKRQVEFKTDKLIDLYNNPDGQFAKSINIADMREANNWDPSSLLSFSSQKDKEGYVPISSLATVFAGAQYTISAFELSQEKTDYRILTSKDIEDGTINWDGLNYIVMEKTLYDQYAVHKNDVVVTSKSSKVKTVVVDIEPEGKVIVTGGMIIVRPDTNKLNPTYLKMYLDSDEGQNALKNVQTGSTIIHISPRAFEEIRIPQISLAKQNKLSNSYNVKLALLNSYKEKINQIQNDLTSVFQSAVFDNENDSIYELSESYKKSIKKEENEGKK